MSRLTDFLVGFSVALFLHGLLVLGAAWFWTLRPPEFRPAFQAGDISLAVTFVAVAETRGARSTERGAKADSVRRDPETTDLLTDPETEMPEDGNQTADDAPGRSAPAEPGRRQTTDDGRRTPDAREQTKEEEEGVDQDMPDAETVAPVSAQASANVPEDGNLTADGRRQTTEGKGEIEGGKPDSAVEPPSDALSQGVSGAVRRKSEIRPYYPLGARLRGEEGAVTVRVWVKPSGRVSRSEVTRSSGFPALDEAAVDAARRARYVSTRPGAWRAEVETTLTFRFQLKE